MAVMPDLIGHLLRVIWCYPELLRLRVSISSCIFVVWGGPWRIFCRKPRA